MARSRIPTLSRAVGASALTLGVVMGAGAARALECPVAHPATTPTAIRETEQGIREYSNLLAAQGSDVIPEIVTRLKRMHPKASDAEITNYLVTLYCPVLNRNAALGDGERRARLEAFSSNLMQELAKR